MALLHHGVLQHSVVYMCLEPNIDECLSILYDILVYNLCLYLCWFWCSASKYPARVVTYFIAVSLCRLLLCVVYTKAISVYTL